MSGGYVLSRVKNSVGIWAFGPNATRFMPEGYHPEVAGETIEQRTRRAVDGLDVLVDGFEFHYPNEINEQNAGRITKILGDKDVYAIALGLFSNPKYALGSFINPDKKVREGSIIITKKGIDLASELGSKFTIWPGGEGYNYPFQVPYEEVWDYFINGIRQAAEYAKDKGVQVLLEHKNSEPAMKILMRDVGMAMYVIYKLREMGVDTSNVKLNMDWTHLIMNGEPLAEYVAILSKENLLGHQHGNSGWGVFDDDNMVASLIFMQTLALAKELQRVEYGKNGERIGFDLFPYTENQVEAVKQSILQWEFIDDLAKRIDSEALMDAQKRRDAVAAYRVVFEALGLDKKFIEKVYGRRSANFMP